MRILQILAFILDTNALSVFLAFKCDVVSCHIIGFMTDNVGNLVSPNVIIVVYRKNKFKDLYIRVRIWNVELKSIRIRSKKIN